MSQTASKTVHTTKSYEYLEYTKPYDYGFNDSTSYLFQRILKYRFTTQLSQYYSPDFNGKPDRSAPFSVTDSGSYGHMDPVKCCGNWRIFGKTVRTGRRIPLWQPGGSCSDLHVLL